MPDRGEKRLLGDANMGDSSPEEPKKKKRKKTKSASAPSVEKNALMYLNEIRPGLLFTIVGQTGPSHDPLFTIQVDLDGQVRLIINWCL